MNKAIFFLLIQQNMFGRKDCHGQRGRDKRAYIVVLRQAQFYPPWRAAEAADCALRLQQCTSHNTRANLVKYDMFFFIFTRFSVTLQYFVAFFWKRGYFLCIAFLIFHLTFPLIVFIKSVSYKQINMNSCSECY